MHLSDAGDPDDVRANRPRVAAAPVARRRMFYGWWIVVAAFVGQFATLAATAGFAGVVLRPMTEELGWTAAQFSIGTSAIFVAEAAAGVFVGPLLDRLGARPLMLAGAIVFGAALVAMSRVTDYWQFLLLSVLIGAGALAFVGPQVVNVTISKWFVHRRGWAIALGSIGFSIAGLTIPLVMTGVVDAWDWRTGYWVLGIAIVTILIPAALLMRRTPEDHGWLPDGEDPELARTGVESRRLESLRADTDRSLRRAQAVRTRAFWLLVVGFGLNLGAMMAVLVHTIPFLTSEGFSRGEAALALAVTGFASLCSKFLWGWAMGRYRIRVNITIDFALCAVGLVIVSVAVRSASLPLLFAGFFVWGFGYGGMIPLREFVWARYFGRVHLGEVQGLAAPFSVIFGATGPILVGAAFDMSGSYVHAFAALAATYVIAAIVVARSQEPRFTSLPAVAPAR